MYSGSGRSWHASGEGDGSYHYRVRACYGSICAAWGASASETVLLPPASAPTPSGPVTATMGEALAVRWSAVSTTTNYELESSDVSSVWEGPVSEGTARVASEVAATRVGSYQLYFRVRACNAGGCSGWSNVKEVIVNPNLECTSKPCHPVGIGPYTKPAAQGSGSGGSPSGGDPAVTWNALGEAQTIVTGSTTVHLTYGPDGGLVDTSGAYGGRYFGRWLKWQSSTQWSARIIVNGQVVAVVKDSAGSVATSYLVAGPLGSTRAVANASGSLTQRIAYSAWGKFVNPATGTGTVSAASIAATTTVTYTGHELLAAAGLVNMGARLYDPATGLFMSPDPTLMQPFNTQDLNQYAYVGDNPVSFMDPSGYDIGCGEASEPACQIGGITVTGFMCESACSGVMGGWPGGVSFISGSPFGNLPFAGANWSGSSTSTKSDKKNSKKQSIHCSGTVRAIANNGNPYKRQLQSLNQLASFNHPSKLIKGAFGMFEFPGSVDIIPSQFGITSYNNVPFIYGYISGHHGSASFIMATDVIGPKSARSFFEKHFSGDLILEQNSGTDLGVEHVSLTVISTTSAPPVCPTGTSPSPG